MPKRSIYYLPPQLLCRALPSELHSYAVNAETADRATIIGFIITTPRMELESIDFGDLGAWLGPHVWEWPTREQAKAAAAIHLIEPSHIKIKPNRLYMIYVHSRPFATLTIKVLFGEKCVRAKKSMTHEQITESASFIDDVRLPAPITTKYNQVRESYLRLCDLLNYREIQCHCYWVSSIAGGTIDVFKYIEYNDPPDENEIRYLHVYRDGTNKIELSEIGPVA